MRIAVTTVVLLAVCGPARGERPIDIGSRRELFVDDYLIESLTNTKQVMNPAQKMEHNPVIRPERPWEGNDVRPSHVMFDEKEQVFKMWYSARTFRAHQGKDEIVVEGEVSVTETEPEAAGAMVGISIRLLE